MHTCCLTLSACFDTYVDSTIFVPKPVSNFKAGSDFVKLRDG